MHLRVAYHGAGGGMNVAAACRARGAPALGVGAPVRASVPVRGAQVTEVRAAAAGRGFAGHVVAGAVRFDDGVATFRAARRDLE